MTTPNSPTEARTWIPEPRQPTTTPAGIAIGLENQAVEPQPERAVDHLVHHGSTCWWDHRAATWHCPSPR